MFIGAYWKCRASSVAESASAIHGLLVDLRKTELGDRMDRLLTTTPSGVLEPIRLGSPGDLVGSFDEIGSGRNGVQLGRIFSAFENEGQGDFEVRAVIGVESEYVSNSVAIWLDRTLGPPTEREEEVLQLLVSHFDPEHATITDHERIAAARDEPIWKGGWRRYP